MKLKFSSDTGGYFVAIEASFLGDDLLVSCTGGQKPHIGAVAVASPGSDSSGAKKSAASASVICLPGHREDELARAAALRICKRLGCSVTIVAGMHWDDIDLDGIEQVVINVDDLVEQLLVELTGGEAET